MRRFFEAQSVTVVGVSSGSGNLGRAIIYNLLQYRFNGVVYAVGPKGGSFLGFKIYPSVRDVPEPTDIAAILVPARAVPEVLEQCGEKGIRYVVVESAGFRELAEERRDLEEEIIKILDKYGMRLIGPNCVGIINRHTGLAVPFMPVEPLAPPGGIALIAQSGGVGGSLLNMFGGEKIGYSLFASIGNKLNVSECDLLEYCLEEEKTKVVFLYLEGIADGRRLMELAMEKKKPILLYKSNRTKAGQGIARSHSASLSSDDEVVDAACRQSNIVRVQEQSEALNVLKGFCLPPPQGRRIGIISRSGGHAVIAADAAEEFGFELVPYPDDILEMAQKHARAGVVNFQNPLDLGDVFDLDLYRVLAEEVLKSPAFDALLFIHHYQGVFDAGLSHQLVKSFDKMSEESNKPFAFCLFTSPSEFRLNRSNVDFPIFTDPREAVKALALARDWHGFKTVAFPKERPRGIDVPKARDILNNTLPGMMGVSESAALLECYGIPLIPWRLADNEASAVDKAMELGFPVAMKTASSKIVHKTETGAVILDIHDKESLTKAYRRLSNLAPEVILQSMAPQEGVEWIVGGRQVDCFGPIVITGLGGIYVEVLRDRSIRIGPLGEEEAERMIEDTRGAPLFKPFRGKKPKNKEALRDIIVRISWLLYDFPSLAEIDINPLWITEESALALDWRIITS